ncbi:MAG: hypothetical protein VZR54_03050 [Ruminococcus sp.]|jgi:hypothetical protein|nr:hypothetical protein [Ruminococcus sp.]
MLRRIYTAVKIILCVFVAGFSAFVDWVLISRSNFTLLWIFALMEVVLLVYTFLLFRYVNKTVLSIELRKRAVLVETLGGSYRTSLDRIRIIKGRFNFHIMNFDNHSLRVYPSNKQADAFIKKYFVRIKTS